VLTYGTLSGSEEPAVAELELQDLHVRHPAADVDALTGIDLRVPDGTRTVVIGPSGSGKTTLLRAVGGLSPVVGGRILIGGRDVTGLPSRDRDVAMVHQQGTLQPHLDVRRNLGFALRLRGVPRDEERRRVAAEARAFALEDLLGRRPRTLAAGERHEVALARSLVRRSSVLLLDEPFARVDAHRRADLRRELLLVQQGYGLTTLLATNDPEAAHALGDQVLVLEGGRAVQVGPPAEVAAAPASVVVAELLMLPAPNLLLATVERRAGGDVLRAGGLVVPTRRRLVPRRVRIAVRPDRLRFGSGGLDVPVRRRVTLGDRVELTVGRGGDPPLVVLADRSAPQVGDRVTLRVHPRDVHVFDAVTGEALAHGV
jgi:multiple sugar transport system ATP-binding protein